ncbi:hypothetical protein [Occallatibacter savannae]|uniref:hypothetical protein n=1 Tax=Occallatibacter savannae TaxID=1002691 RepID=UPI0013A59655|nr:hypothetical protein [Occallatibacter savannae]
MLKYVITGEDISQEDEKRQSEHMLNCDRVMDDDEFGPALGFMLKSRDGAPTDEHPDQDDEDEDEDEDDMI